MADVISAGMRVRARQDIDNKIKKGWEGLVRTVGGSSAAVEWDDLTNGHALGGTIPDSNKGWNVGTSALEPIKLLKKPMFEIVRADGTQILIPTHSKLDDVISTLEWARKKDKDQEKEVAFSREFHCFPLDGAYAFHQVLASAFGWVDMVPTPGFFGPSPPMMIEIEISYGKTAQIPWGRVRIPAWEGGYLQTGLKDNPPRFWLQGSVQKRFLEHAHTLGDRIQEKLKTASLYRGKAVRIGFEWKRDADHLFDPVEHAPKFLRPGAKEELIFNVQTWRLLRVGLFTPIEYVAICRAKKIPVRRGILLAGPYGTGKTLTALATANEATRHGWTFWYAPDGRDFCSVVELARQYEPAVVFVEDIDRITAGERDRALDQVLNVLDGLDSKQSEVLVVVTTNDLSAIHPAMLRPGRIDSVIELGMPDADAAGRLATLYGGEFVSEELAETVSGRLAGKSPAVIREIVERAKLAAILRAAEGGDIAVSTDDLTAIAEMVESHNALAQRPAKRSGRRYPEALFRIPGEQVDLIDSIAYMIKEFKDSGKEK